MVIIKGFVTVNQYINNVPGVISPLCELSTYSTTYSTEKGEYSDNSLPGYKLITFKCIDPATNKEVEVPPPLVLNILDIVRQSIVYATAHIRPYDLVNYRDTIEADNNGEISNFFFGPFKDGNTLGLPEWLEWIDVTSTSSIKVWLSDEAFSNEYEEYSIRVIPPIPNLDDFFGFYQTVVNQAKARTASQLTDLIITLKGNDPETVLKLFSYDFVNSSSPSIKTKIDWGVIIYGIAGDNIDTIKDALVDYILANSTHTSAEWAKIFPDIFSRTEFILLPRWDLISIPNLTILSALYSSIVDPIECIAFAKNFIDFYPDSHIDANLNIVPYDYKAIMILIVNGVDNIQGRKKITEVFPDYIPVSSLNLDFNRMSILTREWIVLIEEMLIIAETATAFTNIPKKFRRVFRDNDIYISKVIDNINYLIAAKSNPKYNI